MVFGLFIIFLIAQRVFELCISGRNEKWLLKHGAIEYGKEHYPYIVLLHTLFIVSLVTEYVCLPGSKVNWYFLCLFMILIAVKIWVISTLGTFWNTKIFKIPGTLPVSRGIYKYIRHPNYIIVICEIAIIPITFHLYYTAVLFSLLNAVMLTVRIKKENEILAM